MRAQVVTALAALMLSACTGTVTIQQLERASIPAFDKSTHGVVVGSSSFSGYYKGDVSVFPGSKFDSEYFRCKQYKILYRLVDDAEGEAVGDMSAIPNTSGNRKSSDPYDYEIPDGVGFVQATVVPAGKYEFWYRSVYCGEKSYYDHNFRVPFTVDAGKALYLGELQYRHQFRETAIGFVAYDGTTLEIVDMYDRDVPLLHENYLFLRDVEITSAQIDWSLLYRSLE